jgi:hypothetical protein
MHMPHPDSETPAGDESDDKESPPPVPPDQQDDVVPVKEPQKPGEGNPPMIA